MSEPSASATLSGQRAALAERLHDALADARGVAVYSVVPEVVTPPLVFVSPGDPYLTRDGAAFGGEVLRFAVSVVADAGVNDTRADELDNLLLVTLDALYALEGTEGFEWLTTREIGSPGQIALNATNDTHLAATINVTVEIHRG